MHVWSYKVLKHHAAVHVQQFPPLSLIDLYGYGVLSLSSCERMLHCIKFSEEPFRSAEIVFTHTYIDVHGTDKASSNDHLKIEYKNYRLV